MKSDLGFCTVHYGTERVKAVIEGDIELRKSEGGAQKFPGAPQPGIWYVFMLRNTSSFSLALCAPHVRSVAYFSVT